MRKNKRYPAQELEYFIHLYLNNGIYLNHYKGMKVNHKCVYRLMRLMGLKAVIRHRKYNYRHSKLTHIKAYQKH